MKKSTKHNIEGTAHEVKGTVKQKIGHAVSNRRLEAEGAGEKGGGRLRKNWRVLKKLLTSRVGYRLQFG